MAYNWLSIKDPVECEIMKKYAQQGKTIAIWYLGNYLVMISRMNFFNIKITFLFISAYLSVTAVGLIELPMFPVVLDIIVPLNESRYKILIMRAKFLVDPDEHYYLIHLQLVAVIVASFFVVTSIDSTMMALIHHFVGVTSVIKLDFE